MDVGDVVVESFDVDTPGLVSPEDAAAADDAGAAEGPSGDVDGAEAGGSQTALEQASRSLSLPADGPLRKNPVSCDEPES